MLLKLAQKPEQKSYNTEKTKQSQGVEEIYYALGSAIKSTIIFTFQNQFVHSQLFNLTVSVHSRVIAGTVMQYSLCKMHLPKS